MATQKGTMLKELMEKATAGDVAFVGDYVTEEVQWNRAGKPMIIGKENVLSEIGSWNSHQLSNLQVEHIITHGITAAVNGRVKCLQENGETKDIYFCHVMKFNKFKEGIVKEITSYII